MDLGKYILAKLYCFKSKTFKNLPYDEQFYEAIRMYNIFLLTKYNNVKKSEYDCIEEFLNSAIFKENKIK